MKQYSIILAGGVFCGLLFINKDSLAVNRKAVSAEDFFTTSSQCLACHNQLNDSNGNDVSVGLHWRSAMMSHSAVDPYWQASVRKEVQEHPAAAKEIEDTCSSCHMPMARFIEQHQGAQGSVFANLQNGNVRFDTPKAASAADGVSCTVCHQIDAVNLGKKESFNAGFKIDSHTPRPNRSIFGPFQVSEGSAHIMKSVSGFTPVKATHLQSSAHCGSCHTLYTHALDKNGKPVAELAEQMPYIEWLYSDYKDIQSCQDCHMQKIDGEAPISSVLGKPRTEWKKHSFTGGNFFMLNLISRNSAELGLKAQTAELNRARDASKALLTDASAEIVVDQTCVNWENDVLSFPVVVTNLAGHKLPTAYPSRRVWIRVVVTDENNRVIFESGSLNQNGSIAGNDNDLDNLRYEPHYTEISSEQQVQIFESIMGTPTRQVTTNLLSAASYLKDNRIPPFGFDKRSVSKDVAVWGAALEDNDFGDGRDHVIYKVPIGEAKGTITILAELWYQPIGYRWAENLASVSGEEPRRFLSMLNAMDRRKTAVRMVSHQTEVSRSDNLASDTD